MLDEVSSLLKSKGVEYIILKEEPNLGQTIIEKYEKSASTCNYAIIIASADDYFHTNDNECIRARQNVIFELGYFMGHLGRDRVLLLMENDKIDIPSDISGIVYIDYGLQGWKEKVISELFSSKLISARSLK